MFLSTGRFNYPPDFPDLLEQLKWAKYEGDPSTYAIMIPIRKKAEWWNLFKEERVALMVIKSIRHPYPVM